jgi:hypothetical protein
MATQNVFIRGKVSWVKNTQPDPWGNWKVTIHPVPEDLEKIRELSGKGLKNVITKDEDGWKVTFKRPQQKMIRGKVQGFAPPEIIGPDGNPLRDLLGGNGSEATIKLQVYQHGTPGGGKAVAARWEAMRVDNLIPYQKTRDFDDEQSRQVKGLDEAPGQPEDLF